MSKPPSLFFVAGEQSGDVHGAHLLQALHEKDPHARLLGVGGPRMREAGLHQVFPMEGLQVMGVTDVLLSAPRLVSAYRTIKKAILQEQPDAVVFIDYADFNMLLAKGLRKRRYTGKLIHFISPTVWAWRKGRTQALAETLDLMLTIFPFEEKYYRHTGLKTLYVGNPLYSKWKERSAANPLPLQSKLPLLSLFPGSREGEIRRNFGLMLEAAIQVQREMPGLQLAVSVANPAAYAEVQRLLKGVAQVALVPPEGTYALMEKSQVALATCGTVALELAFFQVPTVVVYRMGGLNAFLADKVFRIHLPHYCMVNILAGKSVFPEFIHDRFTPSTAASCRCGSTC